MMSRQTPNRGMADKVRAWASAQTEPFTTMDACRGLGITDPVLRKRVSIALSDSVRRGEITKIDKSNRQQHLFLYHCPPLRGTELTRKILKAVYVLEGFTRRDIMRMVGVSRDIHKSLTRLRRDGYIQIIALQKTQTKGRPESLYHLTSRDRYRVEILEGLP